MAAARAFGRRLDHTALVPFADCLNHANVQVKYNFNVDGNETFRMFPTGTNYYPKVAFPCTASLRRGAFNAAAAGNRSVQFLRPPRQPAFADGVWVCHRKQ